MGKVSRINDGKEWDCHSVCKFLLREAHYSLARLRSWCELGHCNSMSTVNSTVAFKAPVFQARTGISLNTTPIPTRHAHRQNV
jgi:hypothetical protein